MVILIANKMWISRHVLDPETGHDDDFIQESLQFIEKMGDKTGNDPFRRMHTAASELNSRASLAAMTRSPRLATFNAPSLQMNQGYLRGNLLALEESEFQAETAEDP